MAQVHGGLFILLYTASEYTLPRNTFALKNICGYFVYSVKIILFSHYTALNEHFGEIKFNRFKIFGNDSDFGESFSAATSLKSCQTAAIKRGLGRGQIFGRSGLFKCLNFV